MQRNLCPIARGYRTYFNFKVDLCGPKAVFQVDLTKGIFGKKYRIFMPDIMCDDA